MTIQSMTGFARREGGADGLRWTWELRSVNGKGLDIRLRLPPGFDRLEAPARKIIAAAFSRGNVQATLSSIREAGDVAVALNEPVLEAVMAAAEKVASRLDVAPPRLDGLLAIRGVLEFAEGQQDEAARAAHDRACLDDLDAAVAALKSMRESEGAHLKAVLEGHIGEIADLVAAVEADPSRRPEAIAERLRRQVALLLEATKTEQLDADRLHAEAALLATKADLDEEIDRLKAHVAACHELLALGGPVGRRLDFLAQEFNRESNTICSKSNAATVTAAGVMLKVVIDRLREQVQNLE